MRKLPRSPVTAVLLGLTMLLGGGLGSLALPQTANAAGTLTLNTTFSGPSGQYIVDGSGFVPGSTATVYVDVNTTKGLRRVQTAVGVAANGTFTTTISLPGNTSPGGYAIVARDTSGNTASKSIHVYRVLAIQVGAAPATVNVKAGHKFIVVGAGFHPGELIRVTAQFPTTSGTTAVETKTVTANAKGDFYNVFLTVPSNAQEASGVVSAAGTVSGKAASGKVTVSYLSYITLSSTTAHPGGTIAVHGSGFVPNSVVRVAMTIPRNSGVNVTVYRDVRADGKGNIAASLPVPSDARTGAYTVSATDNSGGLHAAANVKITLNTGISVTPKTAVPGAKINVSGQGFVANSTVRVAVAIPHGSGNIETVYRDVKANGNGAIAVALPVPSDARPGTYTVTATDTAGNLSAKANLLISVHATIHVSPTTVYPGGKATITGQGFGHGVPLTVSGSFPLYGGGSKPFSVTTTTNSSGAFSVTVSVPSKSAAGPVNVTAQTGSTRLSTHLTVHTVAAHISAAPASIIPGGTLTVTGSGYVPGDKVQISIPIRLSNGKSQTLSATATANGKGQFSIHVTVPNTAAGGSYAVSGRSLTTGRNPTTHVTVAALAPSVVATPTTAAPGTEVTVNGFGFAANEAVAVTLNSQQVATATTNGSGRFSAKFTAASTLASGQYTLTAGSASGRSAHVALTVNRQVADHFYFASEYTGTNYREYLTFLNPTQTRADVTITYELKSGQTKAKTISVNAHSRATEDVNADLGPKVSASAAVAADVPISAERLVYYQHDGATDPGATAPSTSWYFANGNTSSKYREYIAMQNPGSGPVQVAIHFMPTHHKAFTVYKNMLATSRMTIKVNNYVHKDAVGVTLTSNGPIVANRTDYNRHGMDSKTGVTSPATSWYFAAGPRSTSNRDWIGLSNPSGSPTHITLRTYTPAGQSAGTVSATVPAYGRAGYLINKIAHRTDVAVSVTAGQGVVVEQMTYRGNNHDQTTDSFGVPAAYQNWEFAAANTTNGESDSLDLFNPNLVPVPVVVQFMTSSGSTTTRTYVVNPLAHDYVDVGSVVPNANLGIVAVSNDKFVALNRYTYLGGSGSSTSTGTHG